MDIHLITLFFLITFSQFHFDSRIDMSRHTDMSRNLATVVVRGVLPGLRRRRTGLLPSGPKSFFFR